MKNVKVYGLLFSFLIFSTSFLKSQTVEDVLYLKKGHIIRGSIIEIIPKESITIETVGRNVFVLDFDEIEKMLRETKIETSTSVRDETNTSSNLDSLYYQQYLEYRSNRLKAINGVFDFGVQVGLKGQKCISADLSYNLLRSEQFLFLLGIGYRRTNQPPRWSSNSNFSDSYTTTFIPANIGLLVYLNKEKLKPFISLKGGITFELFRITPFELGNVGPMYQGGYGISVDLAENFQLRTSITYERQSGRLYYMPTDVLGLNLGFSF